MSKITENRTELYNNEFATITHFNHYPQMVPFVGKDWENSKFLIVGGSHYINDKNDPKLDVFENWYQYSNNDISDEDYDWTNTSAIVNSGKFQRYGSKSHRIYANLEKAILASGFKPSNTENMFRYCAYMNFFQRPAGVSKKFYHPSEKDVRVSNEVFKDVIGFLKPNFIFIASGLVWRFLDWQAQENIVIGHGAHPTSPWWNKAAKSFTKPVVVESITGKDSFIYFITSNGIFS